MKHYMHHVPGRLRIRSFHLKNELLQDDIRGIVDGFTGIEMVKFNPVTGSVTVYYDPVAVSGDVIVKAFEESGYFDQENAMGHDEHVQSLVTRAGKYLRNSIFGSAVGIALEGSPLAFVSYLI